ncbi:MAG: hypothetical protein RIQ94_1479 [Pseudomonadota bacterium]
MVLGMNFLQSLKSETSGQGPYLVTNSLANFIPSIIKQGIANHATNHFPRVSTDFSAAFFFQIFFEGMISFSLRDKSFCNLTPLPSTLTQHRLLFLQVQKQFPSPHPLRYPSFDRQSLQPSWRLIVRSG